MKRISRSILTIVVACTVLLASTAAPVSAASTHDRETAPYITEVTLDADSDGDGIGDETREGDNPQSGKEIKIAAKNVVRGSGATGEITVGEEVSINLPNNKIIVKEVGKK